MWYKATIIFFVFFFLCKGCWNSYCLGLEVHRSAQGTFINEHKYINDLIALVGELLSKPIIYQQLVGSLIYLIITWSDISYTVNLMSQFMHQLRYLYKVAVKKIIGYLLETCNRGLFYKVGSSLTLQAYSDVDWARCPNFVSELVYVSWWCSYFKKIQKTWEGVSKSST